MIRQIILSSILVITVFILDLYILDLENNLASKSFEYQRLQTELSNIRRENIELKAEILNMSSLGNINARARAAGFIEATFVFIGSEAE